MYISNYFKFSLQATIIYANATTTQENQNINKNFISFLIIEILVFPSDNNLNKHDHNPNKTKINF